MPEHQQRAPEPQGPSTAQASGGISNLAGLAAPFLGTGTANAIATLVNGGAGFLKDGPAAQPQDLNVPGFLGGMSSGLGGLASLTAEQGDLLPSVFGGMGNVFGMWSGINDARDEKKTGADRVVGGMDATANGLSLLGTIGTGGSFSLGTVGTMGAGTALTGGGATGLAAAGTAAGSAGAVLGAGVAGWKVGQTLNEIAASDHARAGSRGMFGRDSSGRNRTATDAWIDTMVDVNLGADALGERAERGMTGAGRTADAFIDRVTGTDRIGNAVAGAANLGGRAINGIMDYGGGILGGLGAAVGSIATTAVDVNNAASSWGEGVGRSIAGWFGR